LDLHDEDLRNWFFHFSLLPSLLRQNELILATVLDAFHDAISMLLRYVPPSLPPSLPHSLELARGSWLHSPQINLLVEATVG